jgi:hypothetical protein
MREILIWTAFGYVNNWFNQYICYIYPRIPTNW